MLNKKDPTKTKAWQMLRSHYAAIRPLHMNSLFADHPERFDDFSIHFNDILVDFSKNRITRETLELLFQLAQDVNLQDAIDSMFKGDKINETENRSVLHTALRNRSNRPTYVDGREVMTEVNSVLQKYSGRR